MDHQIAKPTAYPQDAISTMRIICPSCDAVYDVPASVVAARRRMRCARCAAEFVPEDPEAPDPQAERPLVAEAKAQSRWPETAPAAPIAETAPVTPADLHIDQTQRLLPAGEEPVSRARMAAMAVSWAVSLALVLAFGWAMIAYRQPIMRAWPASTRLYAAMGYLR